MSRTFLQLRNEALGDDFDALKYGERAARWVNDGQQRVFRRVGVPQGQLTATVTVTAGTTVYSLPTGLVRILSLRDTATGIDLVDVDQDELDQLPVTTGAPAVFSVYGASLQISPTPGQGYSLQMRYRGMPDLMTNDGDTPLLPDQYTDLLVTYARGRLFRAEDDLEMATFYKQEFEDGIREMAGDFGAREKKGARQIPSMWSASSRPRFRTR